MDIRRCGDTASRKGPDDYFTGTVTELVTHLAFCGGWPVANSAIPILRKAFEEESLS